MSSHLHRCREGLSVRTGRHLATIANARALGDQYLWGRDLLIAPVYAKGATTRSVYLPAGDWYDWWTNARTTGGQSIQRVAVVF